MKFIFNIINMKNDYLKYYFMKFIIITDFIIC